MSTKTSIKRIALVAVSALGLGMVSTVGANATAAWQYTKSLSLSTNSITVVGGVDSENNAGILKVTAVGDNGVNTALGSTESITVQVIGVPTNVDSTYSLAGNKKDVNYQIVTANTAEETAGTYAGEGSPVTDGTALTVTEANTTEMVDHAAVDGTTSNHAAVYGIAFYPDAAAVDHGYYTIRLRLQDKNGFSTDYTVKVQFVTSAADSGAVITNTVTGNVIAGGTIGFTSTQKIVTTVRDANGGQIFTAASSAGAFDIGTPAITAQIVSSTGAVLETLAAYDDGAAGYDHVSIASAVSAGAETENVALNALNGNYGVKTTAALTAAASATTNLRVLYGATSKLTSLPILAVGVTYAETSVTAAGKLATSGTGTSATPGTGDNYIVPLTTTSATVKAVLYDDNVKSNIMTGADVYYTLAYSGCNLADMSPAKVSTAKKLTSDSTGAVSIAITNAAPANGCYATVTFSNIAGATSSSALTRVISWQKSVPTTVTSVPGGDIKAKLASTNTVSWTVLDQFLTPVANAAVTFAVSGANAPTIGLPTAKTDAKGFVSFTWTDSLAASGDVDDIGLASVGDTTFASTKGNVEITYKATMPVVATLSATYGASDTIVPTTNIGGTTGILVSDADSLDLTKSFAGTTSATAPWVKLVFTAKDSTLAAVTGVPTTVTVTGAKLIGADGMLATSKVVYDNSAVYVLGTTTGVATVTAVNGTLTKTATIKFVNDKSDARVVKATSNGGAVTFTVTDAFGNAVEGVVLDVTASNGASLGNGGNYAQFSTAADGTAVVTPVGSGTLSAKINASAANAKWDNLEGYSDSTGSNAVTGAPAGVRSASADVTGTATSDAIDAANEATDAANAATDAANAAAEAADAATAAAQDAQAAVADLAAQVATLIAGIKAQITSLTNLVIKIQKKVKA